MVGWDWNQKGYKGMINYSVLEKKLDLALNLIIPQLLNIEDSSFLYAIGLYTNEELSYISLTANTRTNPFDPKSEWSPADWKYHCYLQIFFIETEAELEKGWNDDYSLYSIDKAQILKIYASVLYRTKEKFFRERRIVCGIFMSRMSNRIVVESISHISSIETSSNLSSLDEHIQV